MKNPYIPFDRFVFRSPLFSFNKFIQYLTEISESEENFKTLLNNKIMQEAIYLASPVLFEEMLKYLQKGLSDKKEETRFKYSIVRYLSRMSTRCTPFGVFAGCSMGRLNGYTTTIALNKTECYERHTRLDMNYLCALAQDIAQSPAVKPHIKYFSNTSIYKFGDKLRYVEYFYNGTKRIHQIAAVNHSEYLVKVFQEASHGKTINDLAQLITDEEVSTEEASEFINELISVQLLISEMEPSVTGQEFLYQTIQKLQEITKQIGENEYIFSSLQRLKQINTFLEDIDKKPIGNTLHTYDEIISEIKKLETKFETKYLFQTDMIKPVENAGLNREIVNDILDTIKFLNKITFHPAETLLSKFQKAFIERYEEREMPLLQVLDNESGIGYRQNGNNGDINLFIDDLMMPQLSSNVSNMTWDRVQSILLKKYIEAKTTNSFTIGLVDKDFEHLNAQWEDLPLTISAMCRILKDEENGRELYIKTAGGSSAANLLGRFCHADKEIEKHVLAITHQEEQLNPNVIFAEVAHLPESRTGNILLRPVLRSYEIPYLAKSGVEKEGQIELSDLMISVRNGKILLRSKRLNKEIIPRLSSAHNFSFHAMPVYHFLCSMQTQNGRGGVAFSWGTLANEHNWLPRVKYKNVILSPARWRIKRDEIKSLIETKEDRFLVDSIFAWRQTLQMPQYMALDDGDNELFVDLENALSIRTLFSVIKKRTFFLLEEFIFNPDTAVVKGEEGVFTNEFIISFYKGK